MSAKSLGMVVIHEILEQADYSDLLQDFESIEEHIRYLSMNTGINARYNDEDVFEYLGDYDWQAIQQLLEIVIDEREHQSQVRLDDLKELEK